MATRILILHGPNLNLLGEGSLSGFGTLPELNERIRAHARELGAEVKLVQSNQEGGLVDALHAERAWAEAVILCPMTLAQTGHVLKEALSILGLPAAEVRIAAGKAGASRSIFARVCKVKVTGKPMAAYLAALDKLCGRSTAGIAVKKTLGRKKADGVAAPAPAVAKSVAISKSAGGDGRGDGKATEARGKTIGPAKKVSASPAVGVTRAQVRDRIASRLKGSCSPGELAAWAREKWLAVDRGDAAEVGCRELLEEALQQLAVSATGPSRMSEDALVELMTRLE